MASAPPIEEDQNMFRSPELPFVSSIVGGLFPGRAIVVSGMVLQSFSSGQKRFALDLCCGLLMQGDHMDNKALHFNPRFDANSGWFAGAGDKQVVLNSYISNTWGTEERFTNPFEEGKPFQIRILVLEKYFKIAVNGKHLCDYAFRVPIEYVKTIFIAGNIRLDFVEFQPALSLNDRGNPVVVKHKEREEKTIVLERPEMPFSWDVPSGGFLSPQTIRFTLTPLVSAKLFVINLMGCGEYFFHFKVYFSNGSQTPAVVRNSTSLGGWLTEERQFGKFPFHKGLTHDVVLHAYGRSVAVDVDGMPFIKFQYREGDDPVNIDRVTCDGDAIIQRFTHRTLN